MNHGNLELLLALGAVLTAAAVGTLGAVGLLVWLAGGRNSVRAKASTKAPPGA